MTGERRGFFRDAFASLRKLVEESAEVAPEPSFVPPEHGPMPPAAPPTRRVRRPPGALPDAAFLAACTRCGACVTACPEGTLISVEGGAPEARVETHPCVMCAGVPCAAACETGALVVGPREQVIAFGTARVLTRLCLNHGRPADADEAPCERCTDWCPLPGTLVLDDDVIPRVDAATCTGCGLCAAHCAAYPRAIGITDGGRAQ